MDDINWEEREVRAPRTAGKRPAAGPYRLALLAYLAIKAGWLLLGRPV